jgi:trimethylamine-N-oxide reductase (cytochrome c)
MAGAKQRILADKFPECILEPSTSWWGTEVAATPEEQYVKCDYPQPGCSRVHMIWQERSYLASYAAGPKIIEAYRSPEIEFNLRQRYGFER